MRSAGNAGPGLRLLADDLTGALDASAEFVGTTGPVAVFRHGAVPAALPAHAAIDSGTREHADDPAGRAVTALAPFLVGADVAFKKIDSLLRGPTLAEIAACWRTGAWDHAILAPAFPFQGRVTRGGVQHARDHGGGWTAIGGHLVERLRAERVPAHPGRIDAALPPGIAVFDAETDADLGAIAARGRHGGASVLWIGTGGLAGALAGAAPPPPPIALPAPILGLFGSDQPVTATQLHAAGDDWLRLRDGGPDEVARVAARLAGSGRALVSLDLPAGLDRDEAARVIAGELHRLVHTIPPPGTLVVAGGETLRGLCISLGATHLEVRGRIVPGLPHSLLRGGAWDGVTVVSKSGAFGPPGLLRDLLRDAAPAPERID